MDAESFRASRLDGVFDESRAGKRMKLDTPVTWETHISAQGNKHEVWEYLIGKFDMERCLRICIYINTQHLFNIIINIYFISTIIVVSITHSIVLYITQIRTFISVYIVTII